MAKFEKCVDGDFDRLVEKLHRDILNGGMSMEYVDGSSYSLNGVRIDVRVYDKYFMRNGSRASLSLTVVGKDGHNYVSAVGAGGGQGVFFNFSYGAESELVGLAADSIAELEKKR